VLEFNDQFDHVHTVRMAKFGGFLLCRTARRKTLKLWIEQMQCDATVGFQVSMDAFQAVALSVKGQHPLERTKRTDYKPEALIQVEVFHIADDKFDTLPSVYRQGSAFFFGAAQHGSGEVQADYIESFGGQRQSHAPGSGAKFEHWPITGASKVYVKLAVTGGRPLIRCRHLLVINLDRQAVV